MLQMPLHLLGRQLLAKAHLHDRALDRLPRYLPRQRAELLDRRLQHVRLRHALPFRARDLLRFRKSQPALDVPDHHLALPPPARVRVGVEGRGHRGRVAGARGGGVRGGGGGGFRGGGVVGFEDRGGGEVAADEGVGGGGGLAFQVFFRQRVGGALRLFALFAEEVEDCAAGLAGGSDDGEEGVCECGRVGEGLEAIGCRFAMISSLTRKDCEYRGWTYLRPTAALMGD